MGFSYNTVFHLGMENLNVGMGMQYNISSGNGKLECGNGNAEYGYLGCEEKIWTRKHKMFAPKLQIFKCLSVCLLRLLYHELIQTTKEYTREVIGIDPKWLVEFAPAFFKFGDPTKLSKRKRQQRVEPLYNRFTMLLLLLCCCPTKQLLQSLFSPYHDT